MKRLQSAPRTTPQPGSCGTSVGVSGILPPGSPQKGYEKIPFSCAHSYSTPLQTASDFQSVISILQSLVLFGILGAQMAKKWGFTQVISPVVLAGTSPGQRQELCENIQ